MCSPCTLSAFGMFNPSILCEPQQCSTGRFSANPNSESQASNVGLYGRADRAENEKAKSVEHSAVCRAAAVAPPANGCICTLLNVLDELSHRVSARLERWIVANLAFGRGDKFDGLIPLPAKHALSVCVTAPCAAAAVAVGTDVF